VTPNLVITPTGPPVERHRASFEVLDNGAKLLLTLHLTRRDGRTWRVDGMQIIDDETEAYYRLDVTGRWTRRTPLWAQGFAVDHVARMNGETA
jgi:hypothetical protein